MDESIVEKKILNSYSNSKFSYFVFDNYENFADEVFTMLFPIQKNISFGSIIINILNSRKEIIDSFDYLLNEVSNASSFESISDILISYYNKLMKQEHLLPIFKDLQNKYYTFKREYEHTSLKIATKKKQILDLNALLKDETLLQSTDPDLPIEEIKKLVKSDIELAQKDIENYQSVSDDWKIKEITHIFSVNLTNIKSTLENFCTYINTKRSDVKTYLLWDMQLPTSTHQFGVLDDYEDTQAVYLQKSIEFERFTSSNTINRLINVKKYQITNFLDLLNLLIDFYFDNKYTINKCEYCGKYFIPDNRSDEKYCSNPCPDCPSKTCKEYASKKLYDEKKKSDVIKKAHYNTSQYFRMKIKRAKTEREEYSYTRKLEIYMENYEKKKKKFDNNKITEDEFANWIVAQKEL